MPDFGAPVAQNVNAPNPTAGLQTLSDLMGLQQRSIAIKQAEQNLQTGQSLQQSAQAKAAQDAQQSSELQALGRFTLNASKDSSYLNADGSPNVDKYQRDAMAVAPVYGQQYIGQMTTNFNGGVENRKALLGLSADQRQKAASFFANVATNPKATPEDFLDAADQARGLSADPAYQRMVDRILVHMPQTATMPTANASQTVNKYAQMVMSSAAGQLPTAPGQVDTGPTVQPGAQNRFTGEFTPAGTPITKTPAPGVVSTPAGPVPYYGGKNPIPNVYGAQGPTPTTQDIENFGTYQANLNNRVQVASDLIPRIQQAEKALDQIRAGGGTQARGQLGRVLQAAGAPQSLVDAVSGGSLAATQEAEKYLFQTTFSGLKQSMQGDPARVAEFNSAEQVFPSVGTDPRATKNVLNFMTQQAQRDYAEQQALKNARQSGTFNPATWQAEYQQKLRAGAVPGVPSSQVPKASAPTKAVTEADVAAYAKQHNLTDDVARAHVLANGFTIQAPTQ